MSCSIAHELFLSSLDLLNPKFGAPTTGSQNHIFKLLLTPSLWRTLKMYKAESIYCIRDGRSQKEDFGVKLYISSIGLHGFYSLFFTPSSPAGGFRPRRRIRINCVVETIIICSDLLCEMFPLVVPFPPADDYDGLANIWLLLSQLNWAISNNPKSWKIEKNCSVFFSRKFCPIAEMMPQNQDNFAVFY